MKTKRVAVYFNVPEDLDPSELLDEMQGFVYGFVSEEYDIVFPPDPDVTVIDPAPEE
jgi:hypothetical protein